MIWIRRTIALPLAFIFSVLFIVLLVGFRINATIGNPDFFVSQLRQADVYNFIYEDVLPVALEEVDPGEELESYIDISQLQPHVIDLVRQSLPPEWLQLQVENTIYAVLPYIIGDTEGFVLTIPLKDRVEAVAQATKNTLNNEDFFNSLYEPAIDFALDKAESAMREIPSPFALNYDELEPIIRTALPREYVIRALDDAIDEVVPFLTKDKEQFSVKVDISESLGALEIIITDILKRPQTYDYLFEDVVTPIIKQNIDNITQLPIGVELTDDDILALLKEALPPEWYQAQVDDTVDQIFSYLDGSQEDIDVTIILTDRKPAVASAVSELVDQELVSLIDSLPVCTTEQWLDLISNPSLDNLPECRPLDISYGEVKESLGIDIDVIVAPLVDLWIPDQFVLSDAELRQLMSVEGEEDLLAQGQEFAQDGLAYTDEDLRSDLADDYETIEDIRQTIDDGLTFSDEELRDWVVSSDGEDQWQNYDKIRSGVGTGRRWFIAICLVQLLLLLGIGALCGKSWRSRLIWAASVLALASAIAYIAFSPLFSAFARPEIDETLINALKQTNGLYSTITDKGIELAQNSIDSFLGGIKIQAIIIFIVYIVAVVLASFWYSLFRREKT